MNLFIAGGTGTLGNELVRQQAARHNITIFSRDELKQQEMKRQFPGCRYIIGDIRDRNSIRRALISSKPDVVFHVAALKQVDTCEANPRECIETNVTGTVNLAEACIECSVPYMAFSSSDKACLPVNIYGQCKAVSERFLLSLNQQQFETKFTVFRWGNVVGSRGSAIPMFVKRIRDNQKVPITDEKMTRFWISIEEAASFFFTNFRFHLSESPIFPEMKSASVVEVVRSIGRLMGKHNPEFSIVGIRPGEKIHETLFSSHNGCTRSDTAVRFTMFELDDLLKPVVRKVLGEK